MIDALQRLNKTVWGLPTVLLILSAGLYLSWRSGFCQVRLFRRAFGQLVRSLRPGKDRRQGVSGYQALCTALAATVGTGNIAGVAGAISIGGPGAVFWMWVCAFFGMVIKCAEATLAVHYRQRSADGQYYGGPMQMIRFGLGSSWKWLAALYAFFGVVAAFGVGNATQINAVLDSIHSSLSAFSVTPGKSADLAIAFFLALLIAFLLSGGAKRIGKATQALVPFAALLYIALGIGVLILRFEHVPGALAGIVQGAFSPRAVTGGVVGSVFTVCRTGAARGLFSNEAGMGTAAIAHGAADVRHPVQQGMMGIIEVFLDTIVICTVTALVILCSGVELPYGTDAGAWLTVSAFSRIYGGWVTVVITLCLSLFAVATVLGWGYYGLMCSRYLFGEHTWRLFVIGQVITVMLSATLETGTVWLLAETVNGLMAIPNLIALIVLCPVFEKRIKEYIKQ